ncbi:MAG: hypothetical protein HRU20_08350 [Pseudomonadales bacterium]|nr:hypothetical protein [Pseudomonadales bacterium]
MDIINTLTEILGEYALPLQITAVLIFTTAVQSQLITLAMKYMERKA